MGALLPSHGQDALLRSLRLGAEAADLAQLGAGALDAARTAVNAGAAVMFEFTACGLRPLGGSLREPFSRYQPEAAATDAIHEVGRRWGRIATPVVVNGLEGFDRRRHQRSLAYADFYRPADIEQLLCIHLNDLPFGAPGLIGILLTRSKKEDDFGSDELAAARACAAVFRGTVRRLSETGPAREAPMLLADATGRIAFASAAAEELLRPLMKRAELPAPLAEAMAAYRSFLAGERLLPPRQRVTLRRGPGLSPLTCELFAARSARGEPVVGATIAAGFAPDAADRVAAAAARFGLTRAESAVLAALVEGRKNAAIAARLNVSAETVKTHVHRVLGKLQVRNRTEAAHLVLSDRAIR